jgi:hypothetical protein
MKPLVLCWRLYDNGMKLLSESADIFGPRFNRPFQGSVSGERRQ